MKIHIAGGRVVDPASGLDEHCDLFIAAGRIAGVRMAPAGYVADRRIDARGCVVCPGLVDLSARLREPGYEYRATLESELAAAVAGGVTTLACPPDTDPPLDEPGLVEMLKYRARSLNFANVLPVGALTLGLAGTRITEMGELSEAGCVAFGQGVVPVADTAVLLRAMEYAATFDYAVWLQPLEAFLVRGGVAHDGEVATRLGLAGIPTLAETLALDSLLSLAQATGVRLHVCRVSSAAGLHRIEAARAAGVKVTCDVAVHHLMLSDENIAHFDPNCHLVPPLRSFADREALRQGLADGRITALCSDHTPVDDDAKQLPFAEAEPGASGLELLLPLALRWGAELGLSLCQALARISCDPGRVLGGGVGHLSVGAIADLCIFDPQESWLVCRDTLVSQGKNTPYLGQTLNGRVRYTLRAGQVVFERQGR